MDDVTRKLARFIVKSHWRDVPKNVRHEAKRSILNWLGTALGGCRDAGVDIAIDALREFSGPPQATVLGRRERFDILNAAIVNGMRPLVGDGKIKVLKGITTPQEISMSAQIDEFAGEQK